jgi:serine/threonine protein phosphatase PrpC
VCGSREESSNLHSGDPHVKAQEQPWVLGERSEMGNVRDENQDRMIAETVPLGSLYVVADGMGGHKGGALAAALTVTGLREQLALAPAHASDEKAIREAFASTNKAVYERAHSGDPQTEGMGSTAVLLLASATEVRVAHAGDSRAYLYRRGRLRRLTADHTVVQRLLRIGALSAGEARNHPDASVLERAIGHLPEIEVEISPPLSVEAGDAFLLCSDGLSGAVDDREIENAIEGMDNAQAIADRLVELSLAKGGEDNITVQFIQYRGAPEKSAAEPKRITQAQPAEGAPSQAPEPVPASPEEAVTQETELVPASAGGTRHWAWILVLALALIALVVAGLWIYRAEVGRDWLPFGMSPEQSPPATMAEQGAPPDQEPASHPREDVPPSAQEPDEEAASADTEEENARHVPSPAEGPGSTP